MIEEESLTEMIVAVSVGTSVAGHPHETAETGSHPHLQDSRLQMQRHP
jgi:hypothetical protein